MTNKILAARKLRFGLDRNAPTGRFFRWWSGELMALVPQWLRQSGDDLANALLIEVTADALILQRSAQGRLKELGRVNLHSGDHAAHRLAFQALTGKLQRRGERVALLLTGAQCLRKSIELPLAAAENLRQVLGFEMDRYTPFKVAQVYFDFREIQRDHKKNRLVVKLAAAPRQGVDASLDLLARLGAPAKAVYVADPGAPDNCAMDLMPAERRTAAPSRLHALNLGLLALMLILILSAMTIPFWQKREVALAMIPVVEKARQQAMAADVLRHELENLSAEYNFMLEKKQSLPPVVVLLDELSRLLPDDTWVQQFNLKGKELQIQGETAQSSKLIALLESSKILRDANFRSPLTKGNTPSSERYHLAAEVKASTTVTEATLSVAIGAAALPPAAAIVQPQQMTGKEAPPAKTIPPAQSDKPEMKPVPAPATGTTQKPSPSPATSTTLKPVPSSATGTMQKPAPVAPTPPPAKQMPPSGGTF